MAQSRPKKLWNKNKFALLFLSPWLIGILAFGLIPMLTSLYLSFTNFDLFRAPGWVGLDNYRTMLVDDSRYTQAVSVTLRYVFLGVPLVLIFSLSIALLLNKGLRGLAIYRAIYYVPSLLGGSVAIAILWRQVFGREGLFNQFLAIFGIEGTSWITNPDYALYTLVALNVWQFGSPMVIFLAGLRQIPKDLYEASSIDGAGKFQQFKAVTLPLLTPIIFFNLVMQMINAFQAFTQAYVIGGGSGGPLDSILFYTLYLYEKAFQQFEMGYASAMAWMLLVMIAVCTALLFLTSRKWVHYES
ncbi:carbohydrate ABC transporter permease [Paenibacillus senegalensis]|uniref:carbohydrate ABC transporter permease n=1 Tax=Paenibacillus senegalensis TaxID=1465766 RepID=UPI000289FA9C|nr:sugar ABC transporter permease [Paenibacillus senegalensis]